MSPLLLLPVAAGAALGGPLRYGLGRASTRLVGSAPPGTLVANLIAVAVLARVLATMDPGSAGYAAFGAGFAGALSTWSTFAQETVTYLRDRSWWGVLYPLVTLLAGLGLALLMIR
ncbi:FluC/FEX family fluoride channel [Corynebacterium sphenisci]|uniref:FluC/FEX family fluoride channel n=1 Tax=Corynebacterium sphenisci TaxID=191493 RepID=UPI0026DEE59B|nr:CrcB family protein [Corynebacterium sphenisci]MDO5730601.1 CrcB family protein [Corynebacterium sphenisci]